MLTFFLGLINTVVLMVFHSIFAIIKYIFPMALWPKKSLHGDVALVTGAGSGIGRQVSLLLAEAGCRLVLWDVNDTWNEETARMIEGLGGEAKVYHCDVADRECVYRLAKQVEKDVGRVTVLVNNAGIVRGKRLLDLPDQDIIKTFNVNTLSHFWTLKAFLPSMIEANRGHIVTVSSVLAECGIPYLSDYCASKAAVKCMHQAVCRETILHGATNIQFTLICPYLVTSGLFTGLSIRYQWILPKMTPEHVGKKIFQAIQTEQDYLYLPYQIQLPVLLEHMLPYRGQLVMEDFMGASQAMVTFTGRDKEE